MHSSTVVESDSGRQAATLTAQWPAKVTQKILVHRHLAPNNYSIV